MLQTRSIELKSHFDVVRKLGYIPNLNTLVSVSEVILNLINCFQFRIA